LSRAARSHSVIFFEEPLKVPAGPDLPRLVTRMTPEGVLVATPWIAPDQDEVVVEGQQARLLDELVATLATPGPCRATPGNQPQATSGTHPLGIAFHPDRVNTTKA